MEERTQKQAEKIVREFFNKMTFEVDFVLKTKGENILAVALQTSEAQVLIGQRGTMLNVLQNVLGRLLKKQLGEQIYLSLDINNYWADKEKHLKELAQSVADEVSLEKRERVLFPMSSFERRVIHLELADRADVKTESVGEGEERRIIIRPLI